MIFHQPEMKKQMDITNGKLILDATCGSRTIWFNKNHPATLYMDKREETCNGVWTSNARSGESERTLTVAPDIVADFTAMPFEDETFNLVVWDPPHLIRAGKTSWMVKKYGKLEQDWPQMLRNGFRIKPRACCGNECALHCKRCEEGGTHDKKPCQRMIDFFVGMYFKPYGFVRVKGGVK